MDTHLFPAPDVRDSRAEPPFATDLPYDCRRRQRSAVRGQRVLTAAAEFLERIAFATPEPCLAIVAASQIAGTPR